MPLVALRVTEKTATVAYKYLNYETKGSAGTEKCHGQLKSAPAAHFRVTNPKIIRGKRWRKSGKSLLPGIQIPYNFHTELS